MELLILRSLGPPMTGVPKYPAPLPPRWRAAGQNADLEQVHRRRPFPVPFPGEKGGAPMGSRPLPRVQYGAESLSLRPPPVQGGAGGALIPHHDPPTTNAH